MAIHPFAGGAAVGCLPRRGYSRLWLPGGSCWGWRSGCAVAPATAVGLLTVADGPGHLVEGEALVATNGHIAVVVLPGGEQEQAALGAGVEVAPSGLCVLTKAVFTQKDGREAEVEGGIHDAPLALADAGRDEDGTTSTLAQALGALGGEQLGCDAA